MRIFDNTNTSIGKLAVRVRSPTTRLSPREGPAAGVGDKSPAAAFTDGLLAACMTVVVYSVGLGQYTGKYMLL